MRGMNLQQLRYFVAISQFGHYGQAAKALYVTQSALSNSIKKLEGELGVRLFEHQGRNAVLTDRGKVFAARISPILNDLDNAISEIQADTEAVSYTHLDVYKRQLEHYRCNPSRPGSA